eukprot:m.207759 g.207759  ORF g.207759 m.207759 type:complete len:98 (+) comp17122_c0_seq76:881-1174(+)
MTYVQVVDLRCKTQLLATLARGRVVSACTQYFEAASTLSPLERLLRQVAAPPPQCGIVSIHSHDGRRSTKRGKQVCFHKEETPSCWAAQTKCCRRRQ